MLYLYTEGKYKIYIVLVMKSFSLACSTIAVRFKRVHIPYHFEIILPLVERSSNIAYY